MKKLFNLFFCLSVICLAFAFGGCAYNPDLSKKFSANGFTIKATQDFELVTTSDGIKLYSDGENQDAFNETTIFGQFDCGNEYYSFENTTLAKYTSDVAKVEKVTLQNPTQKLTIQEKISDQLSIDVLLNMYVVNENQNPNGNYDFYNIYCFGKAQNAFIYFNVYSIILDEYYEDSITRISKIISSVVFTQPTQNKTYDTTLLNKISSTMMSTEDVMEYWNFRFTIPNDYLASINPAGNYYNYLTTNYGLDWGSSIMCYQLAAFMGDAILDDVGSKHLINFSTNNCLGIYTVTLDSETAVTYKFYYLNADNTLNRNYIQISVGSQALWDLGFINYFEEQMFSWIQNIEILP